MDDLPSYADATKPSTVFIPHPSKVWVAARVVESNEDDGTLLCESIETHERESFKESETLPHSLNAEGGVEDLVTIDYLHEASVLKNLEVRFMREEIYSYVGNILVAINPYRSLACYTSDQVTQYWQQPFGSQPAHVFALTNEAYNVMMKEQRNQSILVSGESGAGKTETTKYILRFLAAVSSGSTGMDTVGDVERKMLASNPVLEAFGNAKTVRNNNSSRFGKYFGIHFDMGGNIIGAG